MLAFFDRLDALPDLQFMAIFVCLIVAAYGLEYIFDRWTSEKKEKWKMRKLFLVVAILAMASPALAGWNLNFWGSNDKQKKHRNRPAIERPEPGPPVVNVPEPSTAILLGGGIVALAAWKRRRD